MCFFPINDEFCNIKGPFTLRTTTQFTPQLKRMAQKNMVGVTFKPIFPADDC